jgi:hypothetical protein
MNLSSVAAWTSAGAGMVAEFKTTLEHALGNLRVCWNAEQARDRV